jgi:Fe-Mn family superoxide dismutase
MTVDTLSRTGSSPLEQPPLPFDEAALEPVISARTIGLHYGKHHAGYFTTLHKLIDGTPMADQTLEEIITANAGDTGNAKIFNSAAQCWNHNFYWNSLSPEHQLPSGDLAAAIAQDFGTIDACKQALKDAAVAHFGSGWAWLVVENGALAVVTTHDAVVPFTDGQVPLLTVDVWEHAYYIDWQNRRPDHVAAVVDRHLNWEFAAANFAAA